jgi:hypothetical protein
MLSKTSKFRQDSILEEWRSLLSTKMTFNCFNCEARVSAGVYIRGICNSAGGIALDITRVSVVDYHVKDISVYDKFKFKIF